MIYPLNIVQEGSRGAQFGFLAKDPQQQHGLRLSQEVTLKDLDNHDLVIALGQQALKEKLAAQGFKTNPVSIFQKLIMV